LPRPTGLIDAPNAIIRTTAVIQAFEAWAYEYQQRNTYEGESGTVIPKASINAIRSGYPYNLTSTPQVCSFYVDTRILPGQSPLDVRDDLRELLRSVGVPGKVELFLYRPGFEAQGIQPFVDTVRRCHGQVFPNPPQAVSPAVSSMWRDANPFNELGIPALSYGPRSASHAARKSFKIQDLFNASVVYARIAMDLCNQDRPRGLPLGSHLNAPTIASSVRAATTNATPSPSGPVGKGAG
jgi:acetylornithine deacetylase/succinyl-diaminopimelate desuccinylase-like protein